VQARFPKGLCTGGFPISLDGEQGLQHRREEVPRWLLEQEWFPWRDYELPLLRIRIHLDNLLRVEKVRSKAVERVVLLAAYVRYACDEGESDVWAEYVREASEPSLSGFLTWLEEDDVGRFLGEAIGMFPEREDVLDASGRTGWDAVFALQHFRGD